MSWVSRILRATRLDAGRVRSGARLNYSTGGGLATAREWAFLTGGEYPTGPTPAGEAEAMSLPPFGRGVALLANAVAGTKWWAVRWDPTLGVSIRLPDQPAVLTDPDPMTDPWQYRWAAVEDLILYGNHFALFGDLDFRTLRPGWLVPVPAAEVWLVIDPITGSWSWTVGGDLVSHDEVLHVSAGNRSGEVLGRGVLRQYADSLGGFVAAEVHTGGYFAGGALPPAVLQSPAVLTQDQATDLKTKWREMTNTREPVILPSGYVLTPLVSNAEQAQLVESRMWNAQLVAMTLGIPSYKLGLPGASMTYQNIESADIEFVRDSVDRYASPLSEAFSKWLLPRGTTVAWDYAGRMRADAKTTADVLAVLLSSKAITVDEARAVINRPPMPEEEAPEVEPAALPVPEILEPEPPDPAGAPDHLTPAEVPQ